MPSDELKVRIARSMAEIDAQQWDACANPHLNAPTTPFDDCDPQKERYSPFMAHAFLNALETSGSATAKTGWAPAHMLVERDDVLVAAAPAYIKTNSMGEY